jgi:hypothetical protein
MRVIALALAGVGLLSAGDARVFYSKYFKGSKPEYVAITVERSGQTAYKETVAEEPLLMRMTEAEAKEIFDLAEKLDRFQRPIESGLKVAHMGIKTFRWEDGPARHEVQFNYSEDPDAKALADWFEKISETEQVRIDLERTVRFDKLGVHESVRQLEVAWDKKRLVAPQQFIPMLDRVAKNESFIHMARERAAKLAETFRKLDAEASK